MSASTVVLNKSSEDIRLNGKASNRDIMHHLELKDIKGTQKPKNYVK